MNYINKAARQDALLKEQILEEIDGGGGDIEGVVKSVNNISPDSSGDVEIDIEFRLFTEGVSKYLEWKWENESTWTRISNVDQFGLPPATSDQMDNAQNNWTSLVTPQRLFYYLQDIGLMSPYRTDLTDLNDAILGISFTWGGSTLNTPQEGSWGRGFTLPNSEQHATQFGFINGQNILRVRYLSSGTWGAWQRVGVSSLTSTNPGSDGNLVTSSGASSGTATVRDIATHDNSGTFPQVRDNSMTVVYSIPVSPLAGSDTLNEGSFNRYYRYAGGTDISVNVGTTPNTHNGEIHIRQAGEGNITLVPASGVVVNAPFGGTLTTAGQGASVMLKRVGNNEWDLSGQTEPI